MIRIMRLSAMILLFCATASAQTQDYPKTELFGSFSFAADSKAPGWLTSMTFNGDPYLGFIVEVSRHYRTQTAQTPEGEIKDKKAIKAIFVGMQIYTFRSRSVSPFLRLLFGGTSENKVAVENGKTVFKSRDGLMAMFGGGIDVKMNKYVALRPVQLDVMGSSDSMLKRTRVSTGLVLRF